jgi:uncharacterized damage-inducible protein DinB
MKKPLTEDYAPFYSGYIQNIKENVFNVLEDQLQSTISFLKAIPESKHNFSYAEGKWSIKEVIGHLIDTERVMAYRALCISRNEKQSLPGFDEKNYINASNYSSMNFYDIVNEKSKVRESNLLMFKNYSEEILEKRGIANNDEVTVRALLFIIAGHEIHHLNILKERYL